MYGSQRKSTLWELMSGHCTLVFRQWSLGYYFLSKARLACASGMVNKIKDFAGRKFPLIDRAVHHTQVHAPVAGRPWISEAWPRDHLSEHGGAILNCASTGGITATPGIPSYIASRHGVVGLIRTVAIEYAAKCIRVNAVCPGAIDAQIVRDVVAGEEKASDALSKAVSIGRIGNPEEIASAVLWLCSPRPSYVVGHALVVDGGLPYLADESYNARGERRAISRGVRF
ncbi:MAG: SDR family oxidoreductase [Massilia sp.]